MFFFLFFVFFFFKNKGNSKLQSPAVPGKSGSCGAKQLFEDVFGTLFLNMLPLVHFKDQQIYKFRSQEVSIWHKSIIGPYSLMCV